MAVRIEGERLRFSPWAVFDEGERDVLAINAFHTNRPTRLLPRSPELKRLLAGETDAAASELRSEFIRMGLLLHESSAALPSPHGPEKHHSEPFLGRIALGVEVANDFDRQVQAVATFCASYAQARQGWAVDLQVIEPGRIDRADAFTSRLLRHLALSELDRERITWTLRLGRLPEDEELTRLLDAWPALRVIVEDDIGLHPPAERGDLLAKVRALSNEGFVVRPAITTRCDEALLEAVDAWQAATDRAGVIIEPLVLAPARGEIAVRPLEDSSEFDAAADTLSEIARRLESSLLSSEPWASILTSTTVSGAMRHGWSKPYGGAYVDAESRWARSTFHADAFLYSEPRELFPYLEPGAGHGVARRLAHGFDLPDCPVCPLAALCDGYWSPEFDVLQRTGRAEVAASFAAFHCTLRKDALTSLLEAIRGGNNQGRQQGETRAVFADGALSLYTQPSSQP